MYFLINELDYNDLFDYLSNETYSQVEQKNNHLGQNGEWVLIKCDIDSQIKPKKKNKFGQNDQWFSNQIEHIMIINRPN